MSAGMPAHRLDEDDLRRLEDKARARVTWGDTRLQVERLLRSKGLDERSAKRLLDKLYRERAKSIRDKGVRDLAAGGGCILVGGGGLFGLVAMEMPVLYGMALLVMVALLGVYLMLRGFGRVQNPLAERGADTIYNG